jgi:polyhydroxyalkanoate synthase
MNAQQELPKLRTGYNPMAEAMRQGTRLINAYAAWLDLSEKDIDIATLEKEEVMRMGHISLYRYTPLVEKKHDTPILVVYSQIGRFTMLDLQPDRSLIRNMLNEGYEVYLIDWGHPGRAERWMTFEDYVEDCIGSSVDYMCEACDVDQVSLLGICEGGVFSTCFAALHPERIKALALTVTPIDFHADLDAPAEDMQGQISRWVQKMSEEDIDAYGHLPGEITGLFFLAMTPIKSLTKYNWDLPNALSGKREDVINFFRMEKWLADRPDHPGEAGRQWLMNLYQRNELIKGEFMIGENRVDLTKLSMPVLNVIALRDHIVPPPTSRPLRNFVPAENYEELEFDVGHIGTFVSKRACRALSDKLAEFLAD